LNSVDFPTLGSPTMPIDRLIEESRLVQQS
jgi:hypothetical protein